MTPLSQLKSNVTPNTFEILEKNEPLRTWFFNIVKKVTLLRGIETPNEALIEIYNTLEAENFSINERYLAEIWLLKGDWTFKSPKRLTSDDFYPKAKKLENFNEVLLYKNSVQELINSIRLYAYNESSHNFERWVKAKEHEMKINSLEKQFYDSRNSKIVLELLDERGKNAEQLAKIAKLEESLKLNSERYEAKLQRMQEINADLQDKVDQLARDEERLQRIQSINQNLHAKIADLEAKVKEFEEY